MPDRDGGAGFVSIVGAGPGDPGLLTVRGRRAIERADVVLYDHLASPALLSSVEVAGQERVHVGKMGGGRSVEQGALNDLVVKRAKSGQRVVRLKGGDPFVLGRGGEEALALAEAGVAFEIIPGVTSAVAAASFAGIPITHRGLATGFAVVTGRGRAGDPDVDWSALASGETTAVVLMGVKTVATWTAKLMAAGRAPQTPVAFVRWASLPSQRTLITTLERAAEDVTKHGMSAPAVAVVGDVVDLHQTLAWREQKPLFGCVLGVTHDRAEDLAAFEPLTDLGAVVLHLPLTCKGPTLQAPVLAERIVADAYTDLVFTSANGVRAYRRALTSSGLDVRHLAGKTTWAVGPGTARAMGAVLALNADQIPTIASGEGLLAHAKAIGVEGRRFLFPAAVGARRVVPDGLAALGADIDEVAVYETRPDPAAPARIETAFEQGLNMLTVASPSGVRALASALEQLDIPRDRVSLAAIGPTTRAAAVSAGFRVTVVPHQSSYPDLAAAIVLAARAGTL